MKCLIFAFILQFVFAYAIAPARLIEDTVDVSPRICLNLILTQQQVNETMRPYLIDFLLEVTLMVHSADQPYIFSMAVNILDAYMSIKQVYKRHYQLFGIASLFIASKYYGLRRDAITVKECEAFCAKAFTCDQIKQAEKIILSTLKYELYGDNPFELISGAQRYELDFIIICMYYDLRMVEWSSLRKASLAVMIYNSTIERQYLVADNFCGYKLKEIMKSNCQKSWFARYCVDGGKLRAWLLEDGSSCLIQ